MNKQAQDYNQMKKAVDVISTMLSGQAGDNVNIYIHPKVFEFFTGLKVGDKVLTPKMGREKSNKIRKVTDILNGTICCGRYHFFMHYIKELNPELKIEKVTVKDFVLLKQEGSIKAYFQARFEVNGITDTDKVFSLCYITDKGYFSDWTEHEIYGLQSTEAVNYDITGKTITKIY